MASFVVQSSNRFAKATLSSSVTGLASFQRSNGSGISRGAHDSTERRRLHAVLGGSDPCESAPPRSPGDADTLDRRSRCIRYGSGQRAV